MTDTYSSGAQAFPLAPEATSDELDKHHTKLARPGKGKEFPVARVSGGGYTPQQEAGELGPAAAPSRGESLVSGAVRYGQDIARSADTGIARGMHGLIEAPGALVRAASRGVSYLGDKPSARTFRNVGEKLRTAATTAEQGQQNLPIPLRPDVNYQPQTLPGHGAEAVAELLPTAGIGGAAGAGRRALNYAVVPGVAGEGAKQAVENVPLLSQLKPYGDIIKTGAELATGGAAGLLNRGPEAVGDILRKATRGLDPAEANRILDRADQLFNENQRAGRPLTRAEAIYHASDGRIDMRMAQHLAEARGQPEVTRMIEQRGRQNIPQAAGETANVIRSPAEAVQPAPGQVGPQAPIRRSAIGPELQSSTRRILGQTEQDINAQTEPLFRQAETQSLNPAMMHQTDQNELIRMARENVQGDPRLRYATNNAPPESVTFNDQVLKHIRQDQQAEYAAGHKLQGNALRDAGDQLEAAINNATGSAPRQAPVSGVGPTAPPVEGPYETARGQQAALRAGRVNPFTQGPASKIYDAARPRTKQMVDAVFDENADPAEVGNYMRQIAADNPRLAQEVVREHFTRIANKAMAETQRGANPMAGGNIARDLTGTEGRRNVLEAAVRALPEGDARWNGMQRFLDYFRASASRIPGQSATAEKGLAFDKLKTMLPTSAMKKIEQWHLGHNLNELGDLLTNPEAGTRFRQLMNEPAGSRRAVALVARLAVLAGMNIRNRSTAKP